MKSSIGGVTAAALLCVLALTACSSPGSSVPHTNAGGIPCSQDPTCTPYSTATAVDHGKPVSWIAVHPLSADFYDSGIGDLFVVDDPCGAAIDLPITQHGSVLSVHTASLMVGAEGCADGSAAGARKAFVYSVLLSKRLSGRMDATSQTITFSAGTNSITFVTA